MFPDLLLFVYPCVCYMYAGAHRDQKKSPILSPGETGSWCWDLCKGLIAKPSFQPAILFFKRTFLMESPPPSIESFHNESCAVFSLSWEHMKKCLFFLGRTLTTHQSNHPTQVDLEVLTDSWVRDCLEHQGWWVTKVAFPRATGTALRQLNWWRVSSLSHYQCLSNFGTTQESSTYQGFQCLASFVFISLNVRSLPLGRECL